MQTRLIQLNQNKFAFVDEEDFDNLNQYTWTISNGYAARRLKRCYEVGKKPKQRDQKMHRLLLGEPNNQVDHINGNRLDNRKINLRICTQSQNLLNKPKRRDNKSGFKGVCWDNTKKQWVTQCRANGKKYFARFKDLLSAAKAYDRFAKELHGEFAHLNFPGEF